MNPRTAPRPLRFLAWGLSLLTLAAWGERLGSTGLGLQVREADGRMVASFAHANLDAFRVNALLAREPRALRAEWTGYWDVPAPGFDELVLKSDGVASVRLGDVEVAGRGFQRIRHRVPPGPQRLSVVYEPAVPDPGLSPRGELFLKGTVSGAGPVPVERSSLFARPPSGRDLALRWLGLILGAGAALAWAGLLITAVREKDRAAGLRAASVMLPAGLLLVAASLRFEAVVITYWGVGAPDWAERLAAWIRDIRPGGFEHGPTTHPYEGDPFSYLMIARSMGGFFEPSVREPLYPALTRLALIFSGGGDIGINFVSAISSTLVSLAIFALGRRLVSPWASAFAAMLWAVEWRAIVLSTQGWRDDLFTLLVTICVFALLVLRSDPGPRSAAFLGIVGGLALLTRLTSFSFLVPGLLAVVLLPAPAPRSARARGAGLSLFWMLLLAGPFMAACAIAYGDPFHAINAHAAFYSRRAGRLGVPGVGQLFSSLFLPWEFVATGLTGLTSYPFDNKWFGLGALFPGLDQVARVLALAGLTLLLWRVEGVITILAFLCAIVPYAWTWNIPGGDEWRFTLPVYPLFLIAAAVAAEGGVRLARGLLAPESRRASRLALVRYLATGALLFTLGGWTFRWLDWHRVREAVEQRRPALIEPGSRAGFFFDRGWAWSRPVGAAAAVRITSSEARLRLPIPSDVGARVVMRLGEPRDARREVRILLDDLQVGLIPGGAARVTSVDIHARSAHSSNVTELRFLASGSPIDPSALTLLWVRIEPLPGR